jgi:hypothetical protein
LVPGPNRLASAPSPMRLAIGCSVRVSSAAVHSIVAIPRSP